MVSLGINLRVEYLYLVMVTFTVVRDFVMWGLSLGGFVAWDRRSYRHGCRFV